MRRLVYNLLAFEAEFRSQDPLKVKLSIKFQGVDFSISEKSSGTKRLTESNENLKNPQNGSNRLPVMSYNEKHLLEVIKDFHRT